MAAFSYAALDTTGKQQKGILEGDSARQVRQLLRDQGLMPLEVEPTAQKEGEAGTQGASFSLFGPSLSAGDLALITRQLSTLVQAAIPLEEALAAVAKQSDKARVNGIMSAVRAKVMEGHTLAGSLGEFPRVFPDLYRSTVAAGESAGHLDAVLDNLADYTESSQAARQKVQMALIYPAILLLMAVSVVGLLMVFVVPDVVKVFTGQGQELPWITQALINTSDVIVNQGWLIVLGFIALVVLARSALSRPAFRLSWHTQLLRMPLIGRIVRGTNTAQFASTLSILASSGVPLVEALRIAGAVLGNERLKKNVQRAEQQVREGASLNRALAQGGYFPPMMLHMIASGEQSGELDQMLKRTADSQQRDLEALIGTLLGVLEPLMLLFMGGCVFVIVIAIMLPIINLNSII